jgi:hypothetical protein
MSAGTGHEWQVSSGEFIQSDLSALVVHDLDEGTASERVITREECRTD